MKKIDRYLTYLLYIAALYKEGYWGQVTDKHSYDIEFFIARHIEGFPIEDVAVTAKDGETEKFDFSRIHDSFLEIERL